MKYKKNLIRNQMTFHNEKLGGRQKHELKIAIKRISEQED